MKLRTLLPWFLFGGLVVSTVLNLQMLQTIGELRQRASTPNPTEPTLPPTLIERLGLTLEQCRQIEGCSLN